MWSPVRPYLLLSLMLAGCEADPGFGPQPTSVGGLPPPTTGGSGGDENGTETAGSETAGSETAGSGTEAGIGTAEIDEACDDDGDCLAGLGCVAGACLELCSPNGDSSCSLDRICTIADAPYPGLCRPGCELIVDGCEQPGSACKRGTSTNVTTVAVCIDNPGVADAGIACVVDTDCAPGYLCTPSEDHALPCLDDAESCCSLICDIFEPQACALTVEPNCNPLDIPDQQQAGYCGP